MASNRQCLDVDLELAIPDRWEIDAIIHADHADPFSVLGLHRVDDFWSLYGHFSQGPPRSRWWMTAA